MTGKELNEFLKRNKITGRELAEKLNVHWVTVSRWRNGREPIPKTVELALKWIENEGRMKMKFIKLHQNGKAMLLNASNVSEVYTAANNKSSLYFNFASDDEQEKITVDESIDEILELLNECAHPDKTVLAPAIV